VPCCRGEPCISRQRRAVSARTRRSDSIPTLTAFAAVTQARLVRAFLCPGGTMSKVLQLRSERAELNTKLQALAKLEADGTNLSAEQLQEFTSLEAQIADLSAKITRAEAAEKSAALSAVPVDEGAQGVQGPPASRMHGGDGKEHIPGAKMAQMVRLLAAAQGNQQAAAQMAKDGNFGSDVQMALSTVTPGAGGVLVPTNFASDVIEALRPTSVLRKMGVTSLPLNRSEEHTSELQSRENLVCRLLLEKKKEKTAY